MNRSLTLKKTAKILNLKTENKVSAFKLWWHTQVWNNWEIWDLAIINKENSECTIVFTFLFVKKKAKKQIEIRNYYLNLNLRSSGNQEDRDMINNITPEKLNEVFNKLSREGYARIQVCVRPHTGTAKYFKKHLRFDYCKFLSIEQKQFNKNNVDVLIKSICNEENY